MPGSQQYIVLIIISLLEFVVTAYPIKSLSLKHITHYQVQCCGGGGGKKSEALSRLLH